MSSKTNKQSTNQTKLYRLVVPALERIIKNASWRRHTKLVQECKGVIEWFSKRPPLEPLDPIVKAKTLDEKSTPNLPHSSSNDAIANSPKPTEKENLNDASASNLNDTSPKSPLSKSQEAISTGEQSSEVEKTTVTTDSSPTASLSVNALEKTSSQKHHQPESSSRSIPSHPAFILYDEENHPVAEKDAEFIFHPLFVACESNSPRVIEPAIDCFQKMIAYGHLVGEIDQGASPSESKLLIQMMDSICRCFDTGEELIELLILKSLLSIITATSIHVHGESLLKSIRTCYNIFLGSKSTVNQTTAKASLTQMLVIIFRRMEADSSTVPVQPIVVADLMEPAERSTSDQNLILFVQTFITKVVQEIEVVFHPTSNLNSSKHDGAFEATVSEIPTPSDLLGDSDKDMLDAKYWEINMYKNALDKKGGVDLTRAESEMEKENDFDVQMTNKLRRDVFLVFRALCKLSMKSPPQEGVVDPFAVRGKVIALELLKIMLENAGAIFRTSERFIGAIKQYLCLSLLKNCASSLLTVFQLSCSIFMSLVSRFRSGLKSEIGAFFPLIVLRVLENVAHANFQQKMIVLRFAEKLCVDPQILVDIFVNYDCDVDSSNIFERLVNGLLKTAQGVPPGTDSTLNPMQDSALKLEAIKCLVGILRSMGSWTNRQLRLNDNQNTQKITDAEDSVAENVIPEASEDFTSENLEKLDMSVGADVSETATLEQRRAYKLEFQKGIALFNRKPSKGLDFLIKSKKVKDDPDSIVKFLKETFELDKVAIGDYLGEREDNAIKIMHAYVDSFDFKDMEFDDAIRSLLDGFRLPGEAQKIDRIMEKFAERYCRCNPRAFSSADTAYVLAYSVILLNTDAHKPTIKNKMTKSDFIRNNRGINDGKDLPEELLTSLYDRIVNNEIKMKSDVVNTSLSTQQQSNYLYSMMGIDSILGLLSVRFRSFESEETSEEVVKHMQEQFKARAGKGGSVYVAASEVEVIRPMVEIVWAPMLAGFSVPLDQTEDEILTFQCLEGFRHAIHVTSLLRMKTQRDAFITSLAKFTSLHSAGDIKQKNIYAIKTILVIADEDGNYLQDAWEHILTCVSRFEHLHLVVRGEPTDATFFAAPHSDAEKTKSVPSPLLRRRIPGKISPMDKLARRGSYDSRSLGSHSTGFLSTEQKHHLLTHLNLLEQIGSFEMNKIFTRSDRLNSDGIVDFVKALCKVSMEELHSQQDPRVFSLTKIVEISHFNMTRIRLVWSRMWSVLSTYFVTVGCMSNLSVAMYAMDSLRQLAMKFLERDELANYNFQNEFLKPFVIVMRRSASVEIRELIIRCVSQMIFSRVTSVRSGWKIMFMVFTIAASDANKTIVLLAFETIEKIVREYFPYITETETTTFTDCVNCLIAFTNSRFNKDVSLNAIAFLRFCALKLAEGELGASALHGKDGKMREEDRLQKHPELPEGEKFTDKDDHLYFWFPLLAGLSELTFDPRPDIRKSALEVLFDTLRFHGHMFSPALWEKVFDSVLFPIFDYVRRASEAFPNLTRDRSDHDASGLSESDASGNSQSISVNVLSSSSESAELEMDAWLYETCTLALQLVVDLFVKFYPVVRPLLARILHLLTSFIKRPHQSLAAIGVAAFVRLMSNAGEHFEEDRWQQVLEALQDAAFSTLPNLLSILHASVSGQEEGEAGEDEKTEREGEGEDGSYNPHPPSHDTYSPHVDDGMEHEGDLHWSESQQLTLTQAISESRCKMAVQLLLVQAMTEIYSIHGMILTSIHTNLLLETLQTIASHSHTVNSDALLRRHLAEVRHVTQMPDPPLLRLESEAYHAYLSILQRLPKEKPKLAKEVDVEFRLVVLCEGVLQVYLTTADGGGISVPEENPGEINKPEDPSHVIAWKFPVGSARRRELAARTPLVVTTLRAVSNLGESAFRQHLRRFFPLLIRLVCCEHASSDVQVALSDMFTRRIGPVVMKSQT